MKNLEHIKSILIVDDSGTARMIIKQCLQIVGLHDKEYYEAKNGQEALDIMSKITVDLIVTDLNMPIMDGKELLEKIKAAPELKNIYVIVITSSSNEAKENELKNIGANAVVNKPISPANVINILESLR